MTTSDTTLRVAAATALACSVATAIYVIAEAEPHPAMVTIVSFAPGLMVILWLQRDAARTGVGAVQDLGLFVWLAWPIAIPWNALKSRGGRGWGLMLGLFGLIAAPYGTGILVFGLMSFWRLQP